MTALKLVVVALAAVLWLGFARPAKAKEHGFVDRVHKDAGGKEAKYVLFVPHGYTGEKPYPLILFLHGAGEREGGKKTPVEVGIGPAIKKLGEDQFQFFVIIPRCQANPHNWQADGPDAQRALAMLGEVQKDYKIKDIPCWCFHGQADPTVNVERSRSMIEALKKAGGHPEYTEYAGVGHNSWDKAYATPELYTWLLKQHRP